MKIKILIVLIASILVIGCASYSKVLVNDEGRAVKCSAMGFGIIGSISATALYNDCVEKYKEQGFKEK